MNITLGFHHIPGKFLKDGSIKKIKDNMVYIPILKTIQHLLSNDTVLTVYLCSIVCILAYSF